MKNKLLMAMLLLIAFTGSAQKRAAMPATSQPGFDETGRFQIYYFSYTEWGHLPNCDGWGLCNFSDCWFCDVADKNKAKVIVDPKTREGEMLIELNPDKSDEKKAIVEKLVFTISADIEKTKAILHKGLYPFDASVGQYGGYRLRTTLK